MKIAFAVGAVLFWANVDLCFANYNNVLINGTTQGLWAKITKRPTGTMLLGVFNSEQDAKNGVTFLKNNPNATFELTEPDESEADRSNKVVKIVGYQYRNDAQLGHCVEVDWTY